MLLKTPGSRASHTRIMDIKDDSGRFDPWWIIGIIILVILVVWILSVVLAEI